MLTTIPTSIELVKILELTNYSEPQQAVWWFFIPLIIGGLLSLIIIINGSSPKDIFENEKSVNLAILGPNEGGKTTLWNFLKGRPASNVYQETDGKVALSFIASGIRWDAKKLDEPKRKFVGYDINGRLFNLTL